VKTIAKSSILICLPFFLLAEIPTATAQSGASEMLEQARTRARDMEELKAVLNGPDQNMRLATFDIMANSGDDAMRRIAIDIGLASADSLMQGMAFKETILGLDQIIMSLEVDRNQSESVQMVSQSYLDTKGDSLSLVVSERDRKTGTIKMNKNTGQVSGTILTYSNHNGSEQGSLTLIDETTISGKIRFFVYGKQAFGNFVATSTIR